MKSFEVAWATSKEFVFVDVQGHVLDCGVVSIMNGQRVHTEFDRPARRSVTASGGNHHFFLPRRYMRSAIDRLFINRTIEISTSATP